ncbi:MAG: sigma-70 family RNA polymerase sigma factor [Planctomycetota bacterium]
MNLADMPPTADAGSADRQVAFMRAFAGSYRRIFASVLAVVPHRDEAEEVVQDVCVVLWEKFDKFDPSTNFTAWACTVAFRQAKAHTRRSRRAAGVTFDEAVMRRIAQVRAGASELLELRREQLGRCLDGLKADDKAFLMRFYAGESTVVEIARDEGRSAAALYVKLNRLRRRLSDCVRRRMRGGVQ